MNVSIDTNIIIAVAGGIVSISAAYVVVRKSIKSITDKIKDNLKKELKEEVKSEIVEPTFTKVTEQHDKDLNVITDRLESITRQFEECSQAVLEEQRKMNESAKEFRISTLKGLIVQSHSTYTQLGHIEPMVLSTLEDIYKTYTDIGGNHFVADLMEEIRALPKE